MDIHESRRSFIKYWTASAAALGMGSVLGCVPANQGATPAEGQAPATPGAAPAKKFRAAFSNAGLQSTWCTHGMDTAKWWGEKLGIEVVVYDSQFNIDKQRQDIEDMATKQWDFIAIQAYGIKTLEEPVKRLIDKGIPVIDFDTRIVPEGEDIGLWTFISPDHEWLAGQVTEAIVKQIGGKGKIVHTQGALAHSGAQLRGKGFRDVISKYPEIEVIDEQPADWDINKVGRIWDDLLVKFPQIDAAFFHNDDMAMAAVQAVRRTGADRKIVIGSIDAQEQGLNGVLNGDIIASGMNSAGRIHWTALMIGYFACALGQKKSDVPPFMLIDNPIVTKETATGYKYLMQNMLL